MKRLLLIEDNVETLRSLKSKLSTIGYQIETVSEQDKIYSNILSFEPNMILLNSNLNGSNGRNISQGLKNHYKTQQIPVILFEDEKIINLLEYFYYSLN